MPRNPIAGLSVAECKPGRLYRFRSRNLWLGVFNGLPGSEAGFIGIREKFGSRYLFTEYHHETGGCFGTVSGVKDAGLDLPSGIRLSDHAENTVDSHTGRVVMFDKPVAQGGRGWYYVDTGESSAAIRPTDCGNPKLFVWLDAQEQLLGGA